jgi:hypothetical protein
MKAREGDVLRDLNGILFDVKGLVHPPSKVIAFPRFIPDPSGARKHKGSAYRKVYALSARFEFLEKKFPQYLVYDPVFDEKVCEVPFENVKRYYKPVNRLQELQCSEKVDALEIDTLEFLTLLKDSASVSWNKIGISGSLLVKLHTLNSDIDPVIYGTRNCLKVYETLKVLQQNLKSPTKAYSMEELRDLFCFRFRDTQVSFEDFIRTESRKVLQGKFKARDYFIRFVKDRSEIQEKYGAVRYRNVGYARVKAEIKDDSEAIFTPCSYKLKNVEVLDGTSSYPIEEIASFRGRFCEQARTSERVIAQGKVEHVTDKRQNREYFRLLIGNKPSDYMVLA